MSRRERDPEERMTRKAEAEGDVGARRTATSAAMSAAKAEQLVENDVLLDHLRDLGVDEDLERELGALASGSHVTANRGKGYAEYRRWLNYAAVEEAIAERNRGRLLESNPWVLRAAFEAHGGHDEEEPPGTLSSTERRDLRTGAEAVTSMHSLAERGEGLSAVSEMVAVTRQEKTEEETSDRRIRDKVTSIYGGK